MFKYMKTIQMTARKHTNGGIFYLLPQYLLRFVCLVPLLFLWKTLMSGGVDTGMTLNQMLMYTFIGTILSDLLVIKSPLTNWLHEGLVTSLYQRPLSIYGHVIAQTLGDCLPALLLFSLPMTLVSPLLGISILPVSLWFLPSLILCVSLGFAIDFLFACLLMTMMNATWLLYTIRNAITVLLSGSVIPFILLPWGLGDIFKLQPFGSLGGAVLSIYTGTAEPISTISLQLIWNLILWPTAILIFNKSQERMVCNGG